MIWSCRRHRVMAAMAGKRDTTSKCGLICDISRWRTLTLSGYSIKLALVLNLLASQTFAVPLAPPPSTNKRDKFLFPDPKQHDFANSLTDYEISHPRRITSDGSFVSHRVHHRVQRDLSATWRASNELHSSDNVHYHVPVGDSDLKLNLRLNTKLLSPGFVTEHRKYNFGNVSDSVITKFTDDLCHFTGDIEGHPDSVVAVGTCYGLHGLLHTSSGAYFIEPVKGHNVTDESRGHPHLVYRRSALPPDLDFVGRHDDEGEEHRGRKHCGVHDDATADDKRESWEKAHPEARDDHHGNSNTRQGNHGNTRQPSAHSRRKRSVSLERYVETLIVVDDKMYEHYKDDDLRNYILTIMNMVLTMYHDSTIGNDINIILTRLVMGKVEIEKFLEDEEQTKKDETSLKVSHHAETTLNSFCRWQKEINPPRDHANHHDVAVLLTRYNICSKRNAPCSTLGLSHVSGMCQPHRSCNVNEDTGLALAYTIAHELGHNFGMQHDNPNGICAKSTDKQLIMAPVLNGASPLVWSNCSKDAITKFLDRDWGYCLNNEPERPDFPFPEVPPGIMYNADHQCQLQYGHTAKHCAGIDNVCKTLWCKVDNKCLTRLEAAAQGTKCGTNKYCYGGDCMEYTGDSPEAIHGEWGSWGGWTDCSRSCGAGVSVAERHCDNPHPSNGGKYCLGERKRYRICNTDACDEEQPDFRAFQCSEFDTIPYRDKMHTWEPVTSYDNSCQLHCKPAGEYFSVMMKDMVTDGTPCRLGRRDLCISGKCRTIGCDWLIDSEAKEDSCGICHGDGTTCKTVKDEFKEKSGQGYVEANVIPEGARNIRVEEVAEANNYLAVANDKGQYFLNGYWFIQWSGDYDAAGTVLHYKRDGNKEEFFAPGPLKEPLHIMLLFQSQNPGVLIEYTVPNENATDRRIPEFYWKYLPWTHCTVSCGGGHQLRTVVCVEREAGIVDDFYCNLSSKQYDMERACNDHLCPARWWPGPWQHCSVSCGDNGIHHRTVMCVRSHGISEQQALDDLHCAAQEKPASLEPCHHKDPCSDSAYWQAGPWSDCEGTCGKGRQTRNVTCLGQQQCTPELKPITTKDCYLGACTHAKVIEAFPEKSSYKKYSSYNNYKSLEQEGSKSQDQGQEVSQGQANEAVEGQGQSVDLPLGQQGSFGEFAENPALADEGKKEDEALDYKWVPLAWLPCPVACGSASHSRQLLCIELTTLNEAPLTQCDPDLRPRVTEPCDLPECEDWGVTDWSQCSQTCGDGVQTRTVTCPQPDMCDTTSAPVSEQPCHHGDCIDWITGPWNECSSSCGGGEQYRHLQCVDLITQQSATGCDEATKPGTTRDCNTEACPQDHQELQEEKTYAEVCTGDSMSSRVCKALKKMGQCRQRYVQIKCCTTCHDSIAKQPNKVREDPAS